MICPRNRWNYPSSPTCSSCPIENNWSNRANITEKPSMMWLSDITPSFERKSWPQTELAGLRIRHQTPLAVDQLSRQPAVRIGLARSLMQSHALLSARWGRRLLSLALSGLAHSGLAYSGLAYSGIRRCRSGLRRISTLVDHVAIVNTTIIYDFLVMDPVEIHGPRSLAA